MGVFVYLDTILIPSSFFLTIGYHSYLWYTFNKDPSLTSFGFDTLRRRFWFQDMKEGDEKKGTLAVQSLRNTLMDTILTATISIILNLALAALTNNTYNASHSHNHLLRSAFLGSQNGKMFVLKDGSASLFLLVSFLCSSMAIWYLIDANFLINASGEFTSSSSGYTQMIFERGFVLAFVGKRLLCISFPMLLWMLGPVPAALSSAALVWGLYELDFCRQVHKLK